MLLMPHAEEKGGKQANDDPQADLDVSLRLHHRRGIENGMSRILARVRR